MTSSHSARRKGLLVAPFPATERVERVVEHGREEHRACRVARDGLRFKRFSYTHGIRFFLSLRYLATMIENFNAQSDGLRMLYSRRLSILRVLSRESLETLPTRYSQTRIFNESFGRNYAPSPELGIISNSRTAPRLRPNDRSAMCVSFSRLLKLGRFKYPIRDVSRVQKTHTARGSAQEH